MHKMLEKSELIRWGSGGGPHLLRQAIARRLQPRAEKNLHPSRELWGDVLHDSDWLTIRLTKLNGFFVLGSDRLTKY